MIPDRVVVFHNRLLSHLVYTPDETIQDQTKVKLYRVFFPRWITSARSHYSWFAEKQFGTVRTS